MATLKAKTEMIERTNSMRLRPKGDNDNAAGPAIVVENDSSSTTSAVGVGGRKRQYLQRKAKDKVYATRLSSARQALVSLLLA